MTAAARQIGSTEDLHLPDATLTISVTALRSHRAEPVAVVGHDAQSRGAWWDGDPVPSCPHTVRVASRDDRFGGWERRAASAEAAEQVVRVVRTALLAGWRPAAGDPPGL